MSPRTLLAPDTPLALRLLRALLTGLTWIVLGLANLWAAAAIYFDSPFGSIKPVLAVVFLVFLIAILFLLRGQAKKMLVWLACFAIVTTWWFTLKPSSDRPWQKDVEQIAYGEVDGNLLTLHNIRNCDYRAEFDYTCQWETKTFDMNQLRGIDFFLDNWGSPLIAHPILSFDFGPGGHLPMSIEVRKVVGQSYAAIPGFFRQYTLIVIPSVERDVVRLRTNYRVGENLSLYRTKATPAAARQLLEDYVATINSLHLKPQWYNAVTTNCTTVIFKEQAMHRQAWDWRILLNGKLDELEYDRGALVSDGLSFPELKKQAWINPAAKAANDSPDFSELIRKGRVGFTQAAQ
jgi:Ca2+/Na+ antiporter